MALNYIEHFLTFIFVVAGCILISAFAFLVNISSGIMSSTIGLNTCAKIVRIKQYKSMIKKKERKHNKITFLGKIKLDYIKNLMCRSLTKSYIGRD